MLKSLHSIIFHSSSVVWSALQSFVNMSYMYYSVFGSFLTVAVGITVSLCTSSEDYDPKLIHPMISRRSFNACETPRRNKKVISHSMDITASTVVSTSGAMANALQLQK